MTRKDYELIAAAIRFAVTLNDNREGFRDGVKSVAQILANDLETENPRFDRAQFLKACGIS